MAVVPRVTNTSVRRAPLQLPGGSVRAELGAAPVLDVAARTAAAATDLFAREQQRADEIVSNDAEVRFRGALDGLLLDPKDGVLHQRGTHAVQASGRYEERVQRAMSTVEASLQSERQKVLFRARAAQAAGDARRRVDAHVGDEMRRTDAANTEALRIQAQQDVVAAVERGDDVAVRAIVDRQQDEAALFADRSGLPREAIAVARQQVASDLRSLQIGTLIDRQRVDEARLALTEWGDQLSAGDKAKLTAALEEASLRGRAQAAEDLTFYEFSDDMAAALASAREQHANEPELRDEVVRRLKVRFGEQEAAREQAEQGKVDAAFSALEQAGGRLSAIPATLWADLAGVRGARQALESRARQLVEGTEPTQQWGTWSALLQKTPAEIAKLDPMRDLRPFLDDTHFDRALAIVLEARQVAGGGAQAPGGAGALPEFSATLTFSDRVKNAAVLGGLIRGDKAPSEWTRAETEAYARSEIEASLAIEELERAKGGRDNVSPEERQRAIEMVVARKVLVDKGRPGTGGTERRAVQLTRDDSGLARVPLAEIEDADKVYLYAELTRMDVTVTADKVERLAALRWTMRGATPAEVDAAFRAIAADRRGPVAYGTRTEQMPRPGDR